VQSRRTRQSTGSTAVVSRASSTLTNFFLIYLFILRKNQCPCLRSQLRTQLKIIADFELENERSLEM
jgi:hypothetical protein